MSQQNEALQGGGKSHSMPRLASLDPIFSWSNFPNNSTITFFSGNQIGAIVGKHDAWATSDVDESPESEEKWWVIRPFQCEQLF